MPRALTDDERSRAHERLLSEGRERFIKMGLAKTTIDALAKGAGIGKGSFYQFYPSKEALFIAVAQREEQCFRAELLAALDGDGDARSKVTRLLRAPFDRLHRHPFLHLLLDPDTVASLAVRLEPDALAANEADDRAFFTSIATRWIDEGVLRETVDPLEVFDALAGLFLVAVQQHSLGPETRERVINVLIAALVDRWTR